MSVIDGREFFAFEIQPVLALGANEAINQYNDTDDPAWLSANVALAGTKVKINALAEEEANPTDPTVGPQRIRKGNPLWAEIDAVLVPVASFSSVQDGVSELPRDVGALASGPSWARPAIAVAGLAALVGLGYWWVRKG